MVGAGLGLNPSTAYKKQCNLEVQQSRTRGGRKKQKAIIVKKSPSMGRKRGAYNFDDNSGVCRRNPD
jgi:hypothetical protein